MHIRWSGPPVTYDLANRADRVRVYEQVLREGSEDDVRFYIEADELRELFDELVLPPPVRRAWAGWLVRPLAPFGRQSSGQPADARSVSS